ncbi:ribosomal protein S18-alanine N-acetyltransferase [Variovorax sp. J22R133]|uniref:ribosomal protein S18-alanine N-acetyltransferase n=1 Tax=Variovorax brevis TaxID=3053503 RepID=UPI002578D876|nr:ribosomal protein S18-alanine N-acetyltransferase [Variovorax sp. J22R133]MDM0112907.1 ribosomal protein S18-alanine N-acetyltransferase [Variovorax sp. J22R133]
MITEHEITLARTLDAVAIAELSRDAIEYGLSWRWTPRRVLQCIKDGSTNVAVVRRSGSLLGFAIMQYGDDDAHIALFAVKTGLRRQGLGSALLDWLETTARVAGIRSIRLELRVSNAVAMSFYSRHGFEESGISVGYYEGVEDALRMVKRLRAPA